MYALKTEISELDGIWDVSYSTFVDRSEIITDIEIEMDLDGILFTFKQRVGYDFIVVPTVYIKKAYVSLITDSFLIIE